MVFSGLIIQKHHLGRALFFFGDIGSAIVLIMVLVRLLLFAFTFIVPILLAVVTLNIGLICPSLVSSPLTLRVVRVV